MDQRHRPGPLGLGLNVGRGLLMGSADIVPGVSGGTVALIVGIYERLVHAIRLASSGVVRLLRWDAAGARTRLREVEWTLVLPLGVGIVTALVVGSFVLGPLLERYPEHMNGLFFGLVAASVAVPWRRVERPTWAHRGAALLAAAAAAVLVGLPASAYEDPTTLHVAGSAAVAICAMILPGISGAFLLKIFGIYEATLAAVRAGDVLYVAVFVAGAAVGLGLFAKLLEWLLTHRHDVTMAALVGLMLGSLRALWPWQEADRTLLAPPAEASTAVVVALAAGGFAVVTLLVWAGARRVDRDQLVR